MKKKTEALSLFSLSGALLVTAFAATSQTAVACPTDPYLGSVCVTAASYCPIGYVAAAGQTSAINDNQALYSLLGTRYGGDGRNTYGIPDLRGRAPIGTGQGPGLTNFNIAAMVGQEIHTLAISQMPRHNHAATFVPSGGASAGVASGTISLPVNGAAKIATSSSSAGSITPSDHAVLGKAAQGLGGVTLYSPAGTTADLNIGPEGGVTGTASGSVSLDVNLAAGVNGTVDLGYTGGIL
ncbi:phage tail protein [Marinomonas sp. RS-M-Aa-14]|uniref:phage tail protein n=1 Tax=Marinomonas sp. RS-M-Aa-14 TaxID=3241169 RepID=UPI003AAF3D00